MLEDEDFVLLVATLLGVKFVDTFPDRQIEISSRTFCANVRALVAVCQINDMQVTELEILCRELRATRTSD